jgi:predicted acylesterase/phospholipase RssA
MYDTVCLSGGGIKGITYLGAFEYLETTQNLDLNNISHWIGTSVGSMISFLYCINYTTKEIKDFVLNFNIKKLESEVCLDTLLNDCGINDGNKFIILFGKFLENKLDKMDINFIDLYNITNKKLSIVGCNYTKAKEEVFNYINTPNMSVLTAIRISISIPFVFTPVFYKDCYYIDGCFSNGFPINHCNNKTLGMYIKSNGINDNKLLFSEFLPNCLSILSDTIFEKNIKNNIDNIIIYGNFNNKKNIANFNLTFEDKMDLLNIGSKYAKEFIENQSKLICSDIINNIINNIII